MYNLPLKQHQPEASTLFLLSCHNIKLDKCINRYKYNNVCTYSCYMSKLQAKFSLLVASKPKIAHQTPSLALPLRR